MLLELKLNEKADVSHWTGLQKPGWRLSCPRDRANIRNMAVEGQFFMAERSAIIAA